MWVQGRCNQDPNARSVTIMITDSCPECEADHLDIQVLSFLLLWSQTIFGSRRGSVE